MTGCAVQVRHLYKYLNSLLKCHLHYLHHPSIPPLTATTVTTGVVAQVLAMSVLMSAKKVSRKNSPESRLLGSGSIKI